MFGNGRPCFRVHCIVMYNDVPFGYIAVVSPLLSFVIVLSALRYNRDRKGTFFQSSPPSLRRRIGL